MRHLEGIIVTALAFIFGVLMSTWFIRYSTPLCKDVSPLSGKKELCYTVGERDGF